MVLNPTQQAFAEAACRFALANPFDTQRLQALAEAALAIPLKLPRDPEALESVSTDIPIVRALLPRVLAFLEEFRAALREPGGAPPTAAEMRNYENLALWSLYYRYRQRLLETVVALETSRTPPRVEYFDEFARELTQTLDIPGRPAQPTDDPAHSFAVFVQIRRASAALYQQIVGSSQAIARLRADVYCSIFTYDIYRYARYVWRSLRDVSTLVTGPSGSGKELVARAIGVSRFVPFDARKKQFVDDTSGQFFSVNLSALSPTLIESSMFGHKKGAFTGATADQDGIFEGRGDSHTVFLDEIGELDPAIQVKLLRVLQNRTFQRLGERVDRRFEGRIIAATNRDLTEEMEAGRFRPDLYYRLRSDVIETPSLAEQLESPEHLRELVLHVARRIDETHAAEITENVVACVCRRLGANYPWPGNFRELEQCVRSVLVRNDYVPTPVGPARGGSFLDSVARGELNENELLRAYYTRVFQQCGSFAETARRLGVDPRTAKRWIEAADAS